MRNNNIRKGIPMNQWMPEFSNELRKQKISETLKRLYAEGKRKPSWKGLKMNTIHKNKISESMKKAYKEGRTRLDEYIGKKGNLHWNYIDGRSKILSPARYGDDWDAIRYVIYLRDKFTCQDCGIKGIRLDVHHKIPYLYSGDNSIENLITLCRSCHLKTEHKIKKELKQMKIKVGDVR